jgi:5-methylcytosine-specific restriction enzyme A
MKNQAPHKPCASPGCGKLIASSQRWCEKHARARQAEDRQRRGSARERGYDSRWSKLSRDFRRAHPLCALCEANGIVKEAECVDHVVSVKRAPDRKFDVSNLRSLCWSCHSKKTAREDGSFGK